MGGLRWHRSGVTEQQFTDFVKSTYRVLLTRRRRWSR